METVTEHKNHFIKTVIILILLLAMNLLDASAQEMYKTSSGLLIVTVHQEGKSVDLKAKELLILLDYETGKVMIKQEIPALRSNNDSIQQKLNDMEPESITFEGKLGLDYINTTGHPPLDFVVEGTIYPGDNHIIGSGNLIHRVQGTSSACLLTLTFTLSLDDLDEVFQEYQKAGLHNEIHVQVVQSLLARVND
ncbi:MAG: hypothetical protein V2I62_11240 [Bacteroidales bacterium]|jgi:hypothetical protein|nr:hypothetical protein [Bacteroidales bacterium]